MTSESTKGGVHKSDLAFLDQCPVPRVIKPELLAIKSDLGLNADQFIFTSIFRGIEARDMLAQYGKHDQTYLYEHQGTQGIGAANPPGQSTHELYSDGVAYNIPAGSRLPFFYMCGIDCSDAYVQGCMDSARKRNWVLTITYPTSPTEYHHLNFREMPQVFDVIELGDNGPRVERLTKRLRYIHKNGNGPYWDHESQSEFGKRVKDAVEEFQHDHHLRSDGEVGPRTAHQIAVTFRNQWKHRHNGKDHPTMVHHLQEA